MHENTSSAPTVEKKRRPSLTRKQWSRHVAAWQVSGLSKKDYCARHDINATCLISHVSALKASGGKKFRSVRVATPDVERRAGSTTIVEILVGQSVRVRLNDVQDPFLVVGILRGIADAADH